MYMVPAIKGGTPIDQQRFFEIVNRVLLDSAIPRSTVYTINTVFACTADSKHHMDDITVTTVKTMSVVCTCAHDGIHTRPSLFFSPASTLWLVGAQKGSVPRRIDAFGVET